MKLKFYIIIIVLISYCEIASSQVAFQKTFGGANYDRAFSAIQTSDGGYIFTGVSSSFGAGNGDVYLVKTNAAGDTTWTRAFGGANAEEGHFVQQTMDGGYIIAGYTSSFGSRGYLIKTDMNGDTLWTKTIGGNVFDLIVSVQQTSDFGYILTGQTISFGAGSFDVYLVKLDSSGNSIWTKTYGGTNSDYGYSVRQTSDGGYIIAGSTTSFLSNAFGDAYLIKTDVNGTVMWSKTYGGSNAEQANAVRQTSDGGYIIAGSTSSFGAGASDIYIIKTDSAGNSSWSRTYGGSGQDFGLGVEQTGDHGFVITGNTTGFGAGGADVYLIKTDSAGNTLWSKTFGNANDDFGFTANQTTDGGYLIAGYSNSFTASDDVYLIKTDSAGNSNCNQGNPGTISNIAATQVTAVTTLISTGGSVVGPNTNVGYGNIGSTICISTGVNNNISRSELMAISPNPFIDKILISGTEKTGVVIIYDINGKEKMRQKCSDGETILNTEKLVPGFYLLTYTVGNNVTNSKIIKF